MIVPRVGLPEDAAQWAALALGVGTLALGARALAWARGRERGVVAALAVLAALLSWGYVVGYLRGGPRIIDATSYWLEARALASGHVSWPVGEPETAVLGRFLVHHEGADGARAAVLFPPGYPMLLALGFLVGAPLAVGPLLAAALVVATFALAKEVVRGAEGAGESGARGAGESRTDRAIDLGAVPLVAAALSVVCGAARYHTADTMSHGLAAVCFTAGLTFVLRARRMEMGRAAWGQAALAGGLGGWLFATRPASGLAWGVTVAVVWIATAREGGRARARDAVRWGLAVLVGALPFAIVFLVHQRLATGVWLVSTHAVAYGTNDGPAGCFRYGFGEGIGCLGEHGDFVRANLPDGFGFVAAVKTTARRLWMHLVDAGNAEPLALLVPAGAALAWARPAVRWLALAIGCQVAAYAPFYFDGNYPGGGARLFADVLGMEHVLLAIAAVTMGGIASRRAEGRGCCVDNIAARRGAEGALARIRLGVRRACESGAWIVGLASIGLGVRAGFDHAQLRDRDGGAPLFSEGEMRAQGISSGLLFVESDAAFDLAFDPGARGLGVVRRKGDALDTFAWTERGSPPAFVARFEEVGGGGRGRTVVEPYVGIERLPAWIEGESVWPPRAQVGGAFVLPAYLGGTCASAGRGLRLFRGAGAGGEVHVGVPGALVRGRSIEVELLTGGEGGSEIARVLVSVEVDGARVASEERAIAAGAPIACASGVRAVIAGGARRVDVVIEPRWSGGRDPERGPLVVLDRVVIGGATAR